MSIAPPAVQIGSYVRAVADFPKPGILFRDITPLLADGPAFAAAIAQLADLIAPHRPDGLVAIESRGFIFGAALALKLGLPLLLVRKPGKLPRRTVSQDYQLEYGSDRVEMHAEDLIAGRRYAVIDDVIATGGTAAAAAALVEKQGGVVACCAFLIELDFLRGRAHLGSRAVESVLHY
ncbi:MAG TPA: adenine phosphoribosyltransferase [Nevskia sp.]|nr:adenine phosphoribosyltransferase [Nevskia sp.]